MRDIEYIMENCLTSVALVLDVLASLEYARVQRVSFKADNLVISPVIVDIASLGSGHFSVPPPRGEVVAVRRIGKHFVVASCCLSERISSQ
jgi:hypothetical protein